MNGYTQAGATPRSPLLLGILASMGAVLLATVLPGLFYHPPADKPQRILSWGQFLERRQRVRPQRLFH